MQSPDPLRKYFWDLTEDASPAFRLRRLLEYASFPDLLRVPFDFVKANIASINPDRLRTTGQRVEFVRRLKRVIGGCDDWNSAVLRIAGVDP